MPDTNAYDSIITRGRLQQSWQQHSSLTRAGEPPRPAEDPELVLGRRVGRGGCGLLQPHRHVCVGLLGLFDSEQSTASGKNNWLDGAGGALTV